jgi:hypothetical protein
MSRNQKGFWQSLERLADGAVMAEWKRELGSEFEQARPFLQLRPEVATSHPCMNLLGCEVPHWVEEVGPGKWVAVCEEDEVCPTFELKGEDVLVFGLDVRLLCDQVAKGLGLSPTFVTKLGQVRAVPVGTHGAMRSDVFLMFPRDVARMAREVERLICAHADPFLVFTPTGGYCTPEVESALKRQGCLHLALSRVLGLGGAGMLKPAPAAAAVLAEFEKRHSKGPGLEKAVERIDRNMEAVAKGTFELRRENEELRTLQKEGFFKFALKVDGEDFRAFAIIMALGNRKAAADFLKVPHRSFYDRVEKWTSRGKDYQRLYRFVEWRKNVGRKIMIKLGDSMQSGEPNDAPENPETVEAVADRIASADNRDYPTILREILEALAEQNPENWAEVRAEVMGIITEELGS